MMLERRSRNQCAERVHTSAHEKYDRKQERRSARFQDLFHFQALTSKQSINNAHKRNAPIADMIRAITNDGRQIRKR